MSPTLWPHRQSSNISCRPDVARLSGIRPILLAALLSAGLVVVRSAVQAAAPGQTYDRCQGTANGTTATLMECARVEDHRLDAKLNDMYKTLMVALSEARKTLLQQAQRDWLAFRHDECAFRSSAEAGGSDAPLVADSCVLELTRTRIDVLKQAMIEAGP